MTTAPDKLGEPGKLGDLDDLGKLADACGIAAAYHDFGGQLHLTSQDTLRALLRAMGQLDPDHNTDSGAAEALAALHAANAARHIPSEHLMPEGQQAQFSGLPPCDWSLACEAGTEHGQGTCSGQITLPALPFGYYTLTLKGPTWEQECFVIVPPARGAPSVADITGQPRAWGVCGALYGLRSATNGGLGSYADLGQAAEALGGLGARFFGINPLHALGWTATQMLSPYSPTHRGFLNIDHIALPDMGPTPDAALIDYAAFRTKHRAALEDAFARFEGDPAFDAFARRPEQQTFATFEALSEMHGDDCRHWPAHLQTPGAAATQAAATQAAGARRHFHLWLQWMAEAQLDAAAQKARAAMGLGLYLDLAVGSRPGSAEAWMNPDTIAQGVTIGAPPDHLNPEGQSWNLAAHAPGAMQRARYRPLREMLSGMMARAGVIRIDHALGLMRSFWQPDDGSPGGYVRQPFHQMLGIIAIEARRAHCIVIGEDLGLVPEGFRETMNAHGLLSYAVWQYETTADGLLCAPEDLRPFALSCFGTHDTPSLMGFWHGVDIALWQRMGWQDTGETQARHDQRARTRAGLRATAALPYDARPPVLTRTLHDRLAQAPSQLTALQLDDLCLQTQAQNLPGTVHEHPNWRRRCPVPVERLAENAMVRANLPQKSFSGDR